MNNYPKKGMTYSSSVINLLLYSVCRSLKKHEHFLCKKKKNCSTVAVRYIVTFTLL